MTEEEQQKIFAKNLNYFIYLSGKQQKEVAEDLGYSKTTFNTWCTGKIMPRMGKVQKIAEYFNIGKSDLLDDKLDSDFEFDAKTLNDVELLELMKKYSVLTITDKESVKHIINSLYSYRNAD